MKRLIIPVVLVVALLSTALLGWQAHNRPVIDITAVNTQQQIAQLVWQRRFPTGLSAELQIKTGVADDAQVLCRIPLLSTSEEDDIYREYRSIEWLDNNRVSLEVIRNRQVGQIVVDIRTAEECATP